MSLCRFATRVTLAVALVVGVAGPAGATSIVLNGSFETGDFTSWTLAGNTGFTGVQCPGAGFAPDGNCDGFFGQVGSNGTLSQTLPTIIGQSYEIRFAWQPGGGSTSLFSAAFDGFTLFSATDAPASAFQFLSFVRTASAASTNLVFTFRDDPGFILLDAVSVQAAVPEPVTLSLVGLGLVGARLLGLRKKSTRA
jgi:hypothetical protein